MLLQGKVALVTGGSHGIGNSIVQALARHGAHVVFTYWSSDELAAGVVESLKNHPGTVRALKSDARDYKQAREAVEACIAEYKHIDLLVNNVGGAGPSRSQRPIWELREEDWDAVISLNLKSCFNYTSAVAPYLMVARRGAIVNMSSINALRGREGQAAYTAAKGGIIAFTKTVAKELGRWNVTVNAVVSGYVNTEKQRLQVSEVAKRAILNDCAIKEWVEPEDVAEVVCFLGSERARHITGAVFKVDAGEYM
mgnify:CR=1 FL=1